MKANYWTQFGAMAIPLGVSLIALATVFSDWERPLVITGIVSIIIGFVSFIAGWIYTIQEERSNFERAEDERKKHKDDELRNKQEHDEIMAMLAGTLTGKKMSSPRIIRFIEKLKEMDK